MLNDDPSPHRVRMWWVCRPDGGDGHLFTGDLNGAVEHINALHRRTGQQHATHEISGVCDSGQDAGSLGPPES